MHDDTNCAQRQNTYATPYVVNYIHQPSRIIQTVTVTYEILSQT